MLFENIRYTHYQFCSSSYDRDIIENIPKWPLLSNSLFVVTIRGIEKNILLTLA